MSEKNEKKPVVDNQLLSTTDPKKYNQGVLNEVDKVVDSYLSESVKDSSQQNHLGQNIKNISNTYYSPEQIHRLNNNEHQSVKENNKENNKKQKKMEDLVARSIKGSSKSAGTENQMLNNPNLLNKLER